MTWIAVTILGLLIEVYAYMHLPPGTPMLPQPPLGPLSKSGPYRFVRHPMYWGNCIFIAGLGGIAGGFWNAFALAMLAYMVCYEWALRERIP